MIASLPTLLLSFMLGDYHFNCVILLPFPEISSIYYYLVHKAISEEKRQKEVREHSKIPQGLHSRHKNTNKMITQFGLINSPKLKDLLVPEQMRQLVRKGGHLVYEMRVN